MGPGFPHVFAITAFRPCSNQHFQLSSLHFIQSFPGVLPLDLYLDEPETAAGKILAPDHPLFAGIDPQALAGVISYDTIIWADPGWEILMTDQAGGPAILEASVGNGRVIVVEPSFDRLTRETASDRAQGAAHAEEGKIGPGTAQDADDHAHGRKDKQRDEHQGLVGAS